MNVNDAAILQFAKAHFEENRKSNSTWNGRQIQNAFKVASALADWDDTMHGHNIDGSISAIHGPSSQPCLEPEHFQIIADGTRAFDLYLQQATGYNDGDRAFEDMVRAPDDYVYEQPGYGYNDSQDYHPPQARMGYLGKGRQQSFSSGYLPAQKSGLIAVPQANTSYGKGRQRQHSNAGVSTSPIQISHGPPNPRWTSNQSVPKFQHQNGMGQSPRMSNYTMHVRNGSGPGQYNDMQTPSVDSGDDADLIGPDQYGDVHGVEKEQMDDGNGDW